MSTHLMIPENSQQPQFSSLSKVNKCLYTETSHFRNVSQKLENTEPDFFSITSASGGIDPWSIRPYHIFYHWLNVVLCLCFFLVYWTHVLLISRIAFQIVENRIWNIRIGHCTLKVRNYPVYCHSQCRCNS